MKPLEELTSNWSLAANVAAKISPVSSVSKSLFAREESKDIIQDKVIRKVVATLLEEVDKDSDAVNKEILDKIDELSREFSKTGKYDPVELLSVVKDSSSVMNRHAGKALEGLVDSQIESMLRSSIEMELGSAGYDTSSRSMPLSESLAGSSGVLDPMLTREAMIKRASSELGPDDDALYTKLIDDYADGVKSLSELRDTLNSSNEYESKSIDRLVTVLERIEYNTDPDSGMTHADKIKDQARKDSEFEAFQKIAESLDSASIGKDYLSSADSLLQAESAEEVGSGLADLAFGKDGKKGLLTSVLANPLTWKAVAVAGAGIAGYQFGKHVVNPAIDKAIQSISGDENATLGGEIHDWVTDDPMALGALKLLETKGIIKVGNKLFNNKVLDWDALSKQHPDVLTDLLGSKHWSAQDHDRIVSLRRKSAAYYEELRKEKLYSHSMVDSSVPGAFVMQNPPMIKYSDAGGRVSASGELGGVSAHFESGNRGVHTVSTGVGDAGGVSYGAHQLSTKDGMPAFLKSPEGSKYVDRFRGLAPGSAQFSEVYKQIASEDPEGFAASQQAFITRTHYEPVAKYAARIGIDVNDRRVQEALYSQSVQHGLEGNTAILNNWVRSGLEDSGKSDADLAKLYQLRGNYASKYASAAATTQRYSRELQMVLGVDPSVSAAPEEMIASSADVDLNMLAAHDEPVEVLLPEPPTPTSSTPQDNILLVNRESQAPRTIPVDYHELTSKSINIASMISG